MLIIEQGGQGGVADYTAQLAAALARAPHRGWAEQAFDWSWIAEQTDTVYRNRLSGKRARGGALTGAGEASPARADPPSQAATPPPPPPGSPRGSSE